MIEFQRNYVCVCIVWIQYHTATRTRKKYTYTEIFILSTTMTWKAMTLRKYLFKKKWIYLSVLYQMGNLSNHYWNNTRIHLFIKILSRRSLACNKSMDGKNKTKLQNKMKKELRKKRRDEGNLFPDKSLSLFQVKKVN